MKPLVAILLVVGSLVAPLSAYAIPILGEWTGTVHDTFASNGQLNDGLLDLIFTNQDAAGSNIAGTFSVVCLTSSDCGTNGVVDFSGGTFDGKVVTITFGTASDGGVFSGVLSDDGNTFSGKAFAHDANGIDLADWNASRVAAVPEPATSGLFGLGLAAIAVLKRRRRT